MKKLLIACLPILIIIILIGQFFSYKRESSKIISGIFPIAFSGKVELIFNNRGFQVKLKGIPGRIDLNGASNDSSALSEVITLGDSLWKKSNSKTVMLKKADGAITEWTLP
jgi:hypothetical protein